MTIRWMALSLGLGVLMLIIGWDCCLRVVDIRFLLIPVGFLFVVRGFKTDRVALCW